MKRGKVRILLGKLGEGSRDALMNLAKAFSEAGYEVIYTELQEPESIVRSALQESVDHIGITTLPGADIEALRTIRGRLDEEGGDRIGVSAGGYMEEKDIPRVQKSGVAAFFPAGTTFDALIRWARENLKPVNGM
jgi:methylmalonyl-CoA mutase C-terminal domain/subunit